MDHQIIKSYQLIQFFFCQGIQAAHSNIEKLRGHLHEQMSSRSAVRRMDVSISLGLHDEIRPGEDGEVAWKCTGKAWTFRETAKRSGVWRA